MHFPSRKKLLSRPLASGRSFQEEGFLSPPLPHFTPKLAPFKGNATAAILWRAALSTKNDPSIEREKKSSLQKGEFSKEKPLSSQKESIKFRSLGKFGPFFSPHEAPFLQAHILFAECLFYTERRQARERERVLFSPSC